MVGAGFLMLALAAWGLFVALRDQMGKRSLLMLSLPFAIALPYLANSTGWILTEMGRQPWIVFGLLRTDQAASATVSGGLVLLTLIGFTLIYAILIVACVYLMVKYARADTELIANDGVPEMTLGQPSDDAFVLRSS